MQAPLSQLILDVTGASKIGRLEKIQSLWSGYGEILRVELIGASLPTVIVKNIRFPKDQSNHPRGWNTSVSHQRKLTSYEVELAWYQQYSARLNKQCKIPNLMAVLESTDGISLVLEDLSTVYPRLMTEIDLQTVKVCLRWLAGFHGQFLGDSAENLWPVGSYWHLATRPDEYAEMLNQKLKAAAKNIDIELNQARFQTLIHGDAKLANFCFSENLNQVSALDFQYVGRGCGMKDVAYFLSSCLDEQQCFKHETELLGFYFAELKKALPIDIDSEALEHEWRVLYRYAWADFERFLNGWSPTHWKMTRYSKSLTERVITEIEARQG